MTKLITVELATFPGYLFPTKATESINWFLDKLSQIPEEFRESATIQIETVQDYDDYHTEITFSYSRPQTDEEVLAEERKVRSAKKYKEQQDLEMLARLKAKYEGTPT